ncbi:MAG: hypothetical protein J6S75_06610 [Thermoguttaceae bacterium]|nr:hypothetical protein [Thermoguttaceae bacterium]
MADIIRIIIESASSWQNPLRRFNDKIIIDRDSIRYEFEGYDGERTPGNWSYTTQSPIFQKLFTEAAAAVEELINRKEYLIIQVDDGDIITFTLIYADKTEASRDFFVAGDRFKECLAIIKKMVPGCEETPLVLLASEDEDDEDYDGDDYDDEE